MKFPIYSKSKKNTTLIACLFIILIILEGVFLIFSNHNTKSSFNAHTLLNSIRSENPKVFEYTRQNLSQIIHQQGIQNTVELTKEAFREQEITMYQCHTLAHMIGHFSRLSLTENFNILTKIGVDFCEGGFKHGLEAEIALQGLHAETDFRPELYTFCSHLLKVSSVGDCYHGAGHEFLAQTLDANKALAICDTLTGGPIKTVVNCYNGVFSEYTNQVGGVDGETGYQSPSDPKLKLSGTPLDFCVSLNQSYQIPCALELNGFLIRANPSVKDLQNAFSSCLKGNYAISLQEACIQSVAAVYAQQVLPAENTLIQPSFIAELSSNLRRAYILGAGTEMSQFIQNKVPKDWQKFCNSLTRDDLSFCQDIFKKT